MDPKQIVRDLLEDLPDDVSLHDIARKVAYVAAVREESPTEASQQPVEKGAMYWGHWYSQKLNRLAAVVFALGSGLGFLSTPTPIGAWIMLASALIFGHPAWAGPLRPRLRRVASERQILIAVAICFVLGTTTFVTLFLAYRRLPWAGPASAFAILFTGFGPLLVVRLLPRRNVDQQSLGA